jgi:hypothetical protein
MRGRKRSFLKGVFMYFTKNAKLIALFAAILVAFAGLISCEQAVTGSTPEAETRRMAGNIPVARLGLIGKASARSLSGLSLTTGSPELSYDFPEFLDGIWEAEEWAPGYADSFYLDDPAALGYSAFGIPEVYGWEGTFQAVYYFDGDDPEERGLFFASFDDVYDWALVPSGTANKISAFYYEKVDADTYYLSNLAAEMSDPDFPSYGYGQPMYPTVAAAVTALTTDDAYEDMLIIGIEYDKQ